MTWIAPSQKDVATDTLEQRLWIQLFYSALANPSTGSGRGGRAGFVMAASDACRSEQELRKQLIEARAVDGTFNRMNP